MKMNNMANYHFSCCLSLVLVILLNQFCFYEICYQVWNKISLNPHPNTIHCYPKISPTLFFSDDQFSQILYYFSIDHNTLPLQVSSSQLQIQFFPIFTKIFWHFVHGLNFSLFLIFEERPLRNRLRRNNRVFNYEKLLSHPLHQ